MHIHTFDTYLHRESPVHRLDPRTKVILTVAFILSTVLLPDGSWGAYLLSWLLLLSVAVTARLSMRYLLTRSVIALPFALAAVTVLFTLPGDPVAVFQVGSRTLAISDTGLLRFLSILLRSWMAVQAAIVLTGTTQFPDLVHALRHLRVPALLTTILSFMYRYLFVLADEALRLVRAREARSARTGAAKSGGSVRWRARVAGGMVGQLFLRSYDRSDRVYNAMLARGYRGQLLTMNPHHMVRADWLALAFGLALFALIQVAGRF